jgi:putative hydrolase of the HAD superfamily
MPEPAVMLFDVGGVLLSNGWDREARRRLVEEFKLQADEFTGRHELVVARFETGRLTLDQYLDRTLFFRPRDFSREDVKHFMFAQSTPFPESLELLVRIAAKGKYLLGTLNNESRELNLFRIEKFGLRKFFKVFFSSCFLGFQKPDEEIYQLALAMTQSPAEECIFVDDRALNVECGRLCGMRAIQFQNAAQLERDLRQEGVDI